MAGFAPLTPLENYLRRLGGGAVYRGGFIEHYLTPVIYPENLAAATQYVLAALIFVVNLIFYIFDLRKQIMRNPETQLMV